MSPMLNLRITVLIHVFEICMFQCEEKSLTSKQYVKECVTAE